MLQKPEHSFTIQMNLEILTGNVDLDLRVDVESVVGNLSPSI
jgi:hypothetical protein